MGAILSLGRRADPTTATVLTRCALAYPSDIVQALEIVHSLSRLAPGTERTAALEHLATSHPAHAVRVAAAAVLGGDPPI